jgi:ribosomal protein S18 acetylase RimI-like enzyme
MTTPEIALREASADDQPFLAALYRDTRRQELDSWGWPQPQREMFLALQFRGQTLSYLAQFPGAKNSIVCLRGHSLGGDAVPIGRTLVDRQSHAIHLVDIALLEEFRGRGIGTALLRDLLQECAAAGIPLMLHVLEGNPAQRLYLRLGFATIAENPPYLAMRWTPSTLAAPSLPNA